jgi:internalin A
MPQQRENIFISYTREDSKWLEMFRKMLNPMIRKERLQIWDDTKIMPGTKWQEEIKKAVASSRVALLLVSPHLLASDFIIDIELPLLSEAQKDGLTILWVAVSRCLYQYTDLKHDQALNDPAKPLNAFVGRKLDDEMYRICRVIQQVMDSPPQQSGGITLY